MNKNNKKIVFVATKFVPFGTEQIVGIASSKEGALKILKREFPYMRGSIERNDLASDKCKTFLLAVRPYEVEE